MPARTACTAALLVALLAAGLAVAGDAPAPYALGARLDDALGTDLDGKPLRLADLAITKERAWQSVADAAGLFGATSPTPATRLADLPGLAAEGGGVDALLKAELVAVAGQRFALVPHAERVEAMTTLGEVARWIEGAERSPIALVVWSPTCPACRDGGDEYLQGMVAEESVRLVAVAANAEDTAERIREYLEAHPWWWRVVLDGQRRLTSRLGGVATPHAFLLDGAGVLRYRGAVYADVQRPEGGFETREHLRDAIRAVVAGRAPAVADTEPSGCPLPRLPR